MEAHFLFPTEGSSGVFSYQNYFPLKMRSLAAVIATRRSRRCVGFIVVAFWVAFIATHSSLWAAVYKTDNFTIHANDANFARQVGDAAENYRVELAELWLGYALPRWSRPCDVTVKQGSELASAGETVFSFSNGEVYDWKMTVQGNSERILDSVLPHEVTHTIIASYLRAPVPRWLDEGMATAVEASSERTHYRKMLATFLHNKRGIAFDDMVSMKEYPSDLTPFYSQSFSVCEYLILVGGHRRLAEFAKVCVESRDWNEALKSYYGCDSLGALQYEWNSWIREWDLANQPEILPATRRLPDYEVGLSKETMLAQNTNATSGHVSAPSSGWRRPESVDPDSMIVARGQSKTAEPGSFFRNLTQPFSSRNNVFDSSANDMAVNNLADHVDAKSVSVPKPTTQTTDGGVVWRSAESVLSNGAGSVVKPQSPSPTYYRPSEASRYSNSDGLFRR